MLASAFDYAWLQQPQRPQGQLEGKSLRVVDLFAGFGGMSLGLEELARALERPFDLIWCADTSSAARKALLANHPELRRLSRHPIEKLIDGALGASLTRRERVLRQTLAGGRDSPDIDFLVGGPPCQGHSDLNNHTRWQDQKNQLYARMARAAEVLEPRYLIIENVPGVDRDKSGVLDVTLAHLTKELGYQVDQGVLKAEDLGVAQSRHRRFVLAVREGPAPSIPDLLEEWQVPQRPVEWAIDALPIDEAGTGYDSPARRHPRTQARIDYLFENGDFRLPDSERPPCHRDSEHNYTSIYGRMWQGKPASTMTTGFMVMGQGRFVHPNEPRTLTPHEGARIQFVPDWVRFPVRRRGDFGRLIGNAVPPKLSYVVGAYLLGLQ